MTPVTPSADVRCRLRGIILPGWLPVPNVSHATLVMDRLGRGHPVAFTPLRRRMATEHLGTVAIRALERVGTDRAADPHERSEDAWDPYTFPIAWGHLIVMLRIGSVVLIGSLVFAAAPEGPSGAFPRSPLGAPFEPSASKPWVLKGWKDKGELLSETGMWNGLPSGRFATQEECREELHAKASPIYTKLTQLAKNNPQLTVTVNSQPDAVSWTTVQTVGRSRTTSEYHVVCYLDQD